ncbi:MAG: DNA-binding response regulator [Spirochaetaceae bacterium]|nr:MAG: DNA-binding response regulator [Spirochaetaceae bacterium]
MRRGVRLVLHGHEDFEVVGEVGSLTELNGFLESNSVDLILLDLRLPDGNGIAAIPGIRMRAPAAAVVLLSAFGSPENIQRAKEAGAAGFLVKDADGAGIRAGIRAALNGEWPLPQPPKPPQTGCPDPEDTMLVQGVCLSPREHEVLKLMASGRQNKEIADTLNLAEKSVRNIVTRLFRKIGVGNRTEAAVWMRRQIESGYLEGD